MHESELFLRNSQLIFEFFEEGFGIFLRCDLRADNLESLVILFDGTDPSAESGCDKRLFHEDLRQEVVLFGVGLNSFHRSFRHVVLIKVNDSVNELWIGHLFLDSTPIGIRLAKHAQDSRHDVLYFLGRGIIGFDLTDILFTKATGSLVCCFENRHSFRQITVRFFGDGLILNSLIVDALV